ncbi:CPBP family intramembrane metalloprotease [Candidatus Peribacteria bacterium]|nr:CPBP family intramembrane metalloprotease [Candidatus Peribacteria bacterium]
MKPNYFELSFILVIGAMQPMIEMSAGPVMATYYNIFAIVIVLAYVLLRIKQSKGNSMKAWGFRLDTLSQSILPYAVFVLIAALVLYGYGIFRANTPLPLSFWYVLGMYPVWGLSQQFVLQNFVAKNLTALAPSLVMRSLLTGGIFACAHIPSLELVIATFIAGCVFTYLHAKYKNIFTLGIAHGILGGLVFYLVLGQDQWEILKGYL